MVGFICERGFVVEISGGGEMKRGEIEEKRVF